MLVTRGLERVLGDLTALGYDTRWTVMGAADVGAPHQRDRIWILANSNRNYDAMRGNSQNNAEAMARRANEPRRSICDSGERCEKGSGQSNGMGNSNSAYGKRDQRPKRTQKEHPNTNSAGELAYPENRRDVRGDGQLGVAQEEHDNRRSQTDGRGQWWQAEPDVGRVVDGVAARVDRLKAIGNGQVSEVARRAWEVLNDI